MAIDGAPTPEGLAAEAGVESGAAPAGGGEKPENGEAVGEGLHEPR